jgi:hypothetical protein
MNIENFPFHFSALCVLVALAAHRRNGFPFVLMFMYAAFFYINDSYQDVLVSKLVLQSTLAAMLCIVALDSKPRKYIKCFCLLMLFSILNNILMLSLSGIEAGAVYVAAQIATSLISTALSLVEFYVLTRIIYGTGRGEPIFTTLIRNFMDVLPVFTSDKKAIHSSIWQKRESYDYKRSTEQW